jgi:ABC-type sugar transport system substrate-binding protein
LILFAAALKKAGSYENTAVLVIGIDGVDRLLETVQDGPLTAVSWYGTGDIAMRKSIRGGKPPPLNFLA